MWVVKDNGGSWNGAYYRQSILTEKVIPFLSNSRNVLEPSEVVHLHESARVTRQTPLKGCSKRVELIVF